MTDAEALLQLKRWARTSETLADDADRLAKALKEAGVQFTVGVDAARYGMQRASLIPTASGWRVYAGAGYGTTVSTPEASTVALAIAAAASPIIDVLEQQDRLVKRMQRILDAANREG